MGKSGLWSIIWVLSLIPCISFAQGVSPETNILSSQLDTLIKYQLPEGSNVSISVYDLTANEALYDYQADKLSRPASTMKLLTTITALARPEADEPFSTEVWYKGVIERDTLKGDIYVVGGFDPEFDDEALDSLVSGVVRLPFSVVQGKVYGDVSMKDSLYWGSGWLWDDTPYSFTDSATWPKNLDSTYRGLVSVEEAVAQSINTVPVKLVAQMTPEYSYSFAKDKMGLSTLVSSYQSNTGEELSDVNLWALALGSLTRGVTVRSMTAAYASFANEGVWREARTYTVVKDANGQIILDNTQDSHVAMKDMTAWYITDMLETTVQTGTGTAAQLENMTVAGKTGTTSRDFDRWFAGYTPYYTSAVWCGYNDPEEIVLTDSETNPAIVMWKKVMEQVHQNLKNKAFKQPANLVEVTVCRDSGLLPSDACALDPRGERTVRVTLSAHDVPTETCNVHKEVEICNASGHVANEYCAQVPGNSTHKAALLDVSRAFPKNGVVVLDQAYAILSDTLPAGYYAAVSPDVDAINVECYIHSEDDLPEPEPEEDEEDDGTADSDEDDAQGVIDRILNTWTNAGSNP